jgi:hypothetical protein
MRLTATYRRSRGRTSSEWRAGRGDGHDRRPRYTPRPRKENRYAADHLEAEAGQVSAELSPRGVAADTRVHVLVEILDSAEPPMAAIAQAGKGFDWLADEPDLPDADLVERAG